MQLVKKLLVALALTVASMGAMAIPTEQCVAAHFIAAKNSLAFEYENDEEIIRIWCQCKWKQEQEGKDEVETIEYCLNDTIDAVNERLRMTRYPKE